MAEVTIRLVVDKATGRKDVVISYTSDADALPFEHEDEHRRIVDRLLEGGLLQASELGNVIVERGGGAEVRSPLDEPLAEPEASPAKTRGR
jgi:hypothetical protein